MERWDLLLSRVHKASERLLWLHWNKEETGIPNNKNTFHLHSKLVSRYFQYSILDAMQSPLMQVLSLFYRWENWPWAAKWFTQATQEVSGRAESHNHIGVSWFTVHICLYILRVNFKVFWLLLIWQSRINIVTKLPLWPNFRQAPLSPLFN